MKAALVHDFTQAPEYGEMEAPQPQADEQIVWPRAAAISQLVRAKAAGKHYSSGASLPLVPGVDGVGVLEDGQRVFFAFPRSPFGSMAQQTVARTALCVPVPDDLDDVTAAAIGNPGMSSVAALEYRARFQPGETVLINGAAGASGRLAIQIAKYMGASQVIATARNPQVETELLALGADAFICLKQSQEALISALQSAIQTFKVDIVLDYLWGEPAACILNAIAARSLAVAQQPIRFVNIGSLAGPDIALNAAILRSNALELMGSGLGSVPLDALLHSIAKVLQWAHPAGLQIATQAMPLAEIQQAWHQTSPERMVLTMPA